MWCPACEASLSRRPKPECPAVTKFQRMEKRSTTRLGTRSRSDRKQTSETAQGSPDIFWLGDTRQLDDDPVIREPGAGSRVQCLGARMFRDRMRDPQCGKKQPSGSWALTSVDLQESGAKLWLFRARDFQTCFGFKKTALCICFSAWAKGISRLGVDDCGVYPRRSESRSSCWIDESSSSEALQHAQPFWSSRQSAKSESAGPVRSLTSLLSMLTCVWGLGCKDSFRRCASPDSQSRQENKAHHAFFHMIKLLCNLYKGFTRGYMHHG